MKTNLKNIICAALVTSAAASTAQAQNRSAYFLDNYAYNYQMNPAMAVDRKCDISFPALGNFNFGVMGNTGVKSFIYNTPDGRTTTFLNPEISASEVMSNIKTNNRLGLALREGILSVGFRGLGGYNHVSINAVANAQVRIPGALVSFLKEGVSNRTYEIGRVDAHADAYAEIALNHSREIKAVPGLRVGASVKFLVGIGNVDINLDKADLVLGENSWNAVTNGVARVNMKGVRWQYDHNDAGTPYVNGVEADNLSAPNGYGLAFDLGATYKLGTDWKFGFGITDMGFIHWSNTALATTNGDRAFRTNDYILDPDDFDASWDSMKDDLMSLYQLSGEDEAGSHTRALAATMSISAEYTLPVYRKVSFGLLNTTRMTNRFAWTEFRLSANYTPVKWFGLGVNYGLGTFGNSFGWIINIAPKGFNLYVGMDHTLGKLAKQYVPLNSNAQLSFGINFPI